MIRLKNVTKYYTSGDKVTMALNNINLTFDDVGFVAITGESGSGKSTLLNVISGMDTYEDGEVYFGEQETSYFDELDWENYRRNNVSIIYQMYNLIDSFTVYENIAMVLKMNGDLSNEEIDKRTKEALDKVGILKLANKKACHISSGQKQRLGIARGLAKDTNVIIADEPTGNLDVENGKEVMRLLHELSKDKLVIVVTHNYEQAEEFCDRKVRLFDGTVAEDIEINHVDDKKLSDDKFILHEDKEGLGSIIKKSILLAKKNIFAQPHRMFFNFVLIAFFAFASFLFLGTLAGSVDDTMAKNINPDYFANLDKTRILIKKLDGSAITEDDIKTLREFDHVNEVDMYDNSADINYHYQLNKDYTMQIAYNVASKESEKVVEFLKNNNFVKSSYCIGEGDLAYGELPKNYNEIVIYASDDSVIGNEMEIYFSNSEWGRKDFGYLKAKVVGVLAEDTEQIYFAPQFVYALNANLTDLDVTLTIMLKRTVVEEGEDDYIFERERILHGNFVINNDLEDNVIKISQNLFYQLYSGDNENITEVYNEDGYIASVRTISLSDKLYNTKEMDVKIAQSGAEGSEGIFEINSNTYAALLVEEEHNQCSIYIEDYAYMQRVISALYKNGYEGVSVFNVSALDYNEDLLNERMRTLLLTGIALVVVFILSIFVIFAMLRMKTKDLLILKGLGVKKEIINKSNYGYNLALGILAIIGVAIAVNVLAEMDIEIIKNNTKYMTMSYYALWVAVCLLVSILSAKLFNRTLSKKYN